MSYSSCKLVDLTYSFKNSLEQTRRLTKVMRQVFVRILRTPCLLAMFSKDLVSASLAQVTLRGLAVLESALIMPQVVERAADGLEIINETHRTTAVLSTLAVVALPLVNERIWFGGQNHLLPLLELALPGIDMVRHAGRNSNVDLIDPRMTLIRLLSLHSSYPVWHRR